MRAKAMPGENAELLPDPSDLAPLIAQMLSPDYDETGGHIRFRQTPFFKG